MSVKASARLATAPHPWRKTRGLSQNSLERTEKAERMVLKMQATIAFVSGDVGQQIEQINLMPPISFDMHSKLIMR